MKGHTSYVSDLLLSEDNSILFSGSRDHTIRMWNLSMCSCIKIFKGHNDEVTSVILYQPGILCTTSWDSKIMFWSIEEGECIHSLKEYGDSDIWAILTNDGILVSVGEDKIIRFWKGDVIK